MLQQATIVLLCYLLGSIPFAYLITLAATGKDLRLEGNGNVGSRNAINVAGVVPGLLVTVLDCGKGGVASWLVTRWGTGIRTTCLALVSLVVGHWFPVWLGWRGGVGLAAVAGYIGIMWPLALAAGVAVFLAVRPLVPYFNLAYGIAAVVFLGITLWLGNDLRGAAFIVLAHALPIAKKLVDEPRQRRLRDCAKAGRGCG